MTLSLAAGAALANGLLIGLIPTVVDGIKPSLKARLVLVIQRWSGARQGLLYLSIALLVPAVLTALCDASTFPRHGEAIASGDDVFTHPHMGLLAGIILLYFALENCLEYWPEAYLKD